MIIFRDGETENQALWRVGEQKYNGLLDMTWEEIALEFNKHFRDDETEYYDSSAYRKRFKNFKDAELQIFGQRNSTEEMVELDKKRRELAKERQKLYATKLEYNRDLKHESRFELFYENIRETIEALPMPEIVEGNSDYFTDYQKEYVLCIADPQAGAKFDIPTNSYSLGICQERFNKLLDMMVDYVQSNGIHKINVVELGDSVQGILRLTDLKLNETSVVEATVMIARMIAIFLKQLSAYCYIDYYHTPTSNHSQNRNLGSKASELAFEDMEYVIGNYICDMLAENDRVTVHLNNGYDYIEVPIFDFNIMAMHGHTIKNLNTALKDLSAAHRKLIDYIFVGHWHNGKVIPGNEHESHDTEVLMCPSFQGTDPYAFNKLGLSSKAACKLFVFDKQYGCTGTEKFILN